MRFLLALLLALPPHATEQFRHRLDLEPMLGDAELLKRLIIMYAPPAHHGFQLFFVYGDGALILQAYPQRPIATTDIPTCRNKIGQDKVKELVRLMVQRHFWDLPERNFIFLTVSQKQEELETHTIVVSDGFAKASRTFGVGVYSGRQESIPEDFAVVEEQLKQLKEFTLSNQPCHFAPAVQF